MAMDEQLNGVQAEAALFSSPSISWKTKISLSVLATVTDFSRRKNGTVNRRFLNLLDFRAPANSEPINGVKTSDVSVDSSRKLWFRLFLPTAQQAQDSASLPIIVFFHGGGFAYMSAASRGYDAVCRRFCRKLPAVVISVNYRLAPEHRYPAQYDDGFDVLEFLDDEKNRSLLPENADLSCCFLAGDSAGANLAHHVAIRACQYDFSGLKVIGLAAIQPFFGGEERTEAEKKLARIDQLVSIERTDWLWRAFLPPGEGIDRDHEVINVSGPRAADISKLDFPATLVVVAGFDSLQDWQRRYYQWLKKSGKEAYLLEYPGMVHAFYIFPHLPESGQLISNVKDFVYEQCSKVVKK